jgi:RNA polymerase sigma-70 factor, ECF subfamily
MHFGLASSDTNLIERSRQGDLAAFDILVERYRQRIFNLVYRMTGEREWAEDITVEAFLEAFINISNFKRQAAFGTWLHRLALNVCLESLRRERVSRKYEVPLVEDQVASISGPVETSLRNDLSRQIVRAMQVLPESQRAAMTMFYMEERSCAEIARILSVPRGTVKTRIYNGTRELRNKLRADGIIPSIKGVSDGM